MNVLLIDGDASGRRRFFPNLALMRLSAWHKAQGDHVALSPRTTWFSNQVDLAYISTVFSWNREHAMALANQYPSVILGGSGIDVTSTLQPEVEAMRPDYDLYGIDYGVGFLTRGCPRRCPFCLVPRKEGKLRVVATLDDLINPRSNFVVLLDNNFLALSDWAMAVLGEMADRELAINFSQGLDIRFVTPEIARRLARVDFTNRHDTRKQVTFAFDHVGIERRFRSGIELLRAAGIKAWQIQVYILCGFDSSFDEDMHRVRVVAGLGLDPYVMVYRDPKTGEKNPDLRLRHFARWVNARLWRNVPWDEYTPWLRDKPVYEAQGFELKRQEAVNSLNFHKLAMLNNALFGKEGDQTP